MTGYNIRLRSLWLTYQDYLKYNHSDNESHKPIVTHKPDGGLSVDILKSRGRLRTVGHKASADLKADGQEKLPREQIDQGYQVQEDIIKPILKYEAKGQRLNNEFMADGNARDVKEQNVGRRQEMGVDNGPRRRLLNFNEESMNVDEVDMNNDGIENNTSFISDVDIQPGSGKLLPWERGSLAELQKVCQHF